MFVDAPVDGGHFVNAPPDPQAYTASAEDAALGQAPPPQPGAATPSYAAPGQGMGQAQALPTWVKWALAGGAAWALWRYFR